jgi:hypothetical protein
MNATLLALIAGCVSIFVSTGSTRAITVWESGASKHTNAPVTVIRALIMIILRRESTDRPADGGRWVLALASSSFELSARSHRHFSVNPALRARLFVN